MKMFFATLFVLAAVADLSPAAGPVTVSVQGGGLFRRPSVNVAVGGGGGVAVAGGRGRGSAVAVAGGGGAVAGRGVAVAGSRFFHRPSVAFVGGHGYGYNAGFTRTFGFYGGSYAASAYGVGYAGSAYAAAPPVAYAEPVPVAAPVPATVLTYTIQVVPATVTYSAPAAAPSCGYAGAAGGCGPAAFGFRRFGY